MKLLTYAYFVVTPIDDLIIFDVDSLEPNNSHLCKSSINF